MNSNLPVQVRFDGEHIPVHPHVYSNGHICLSTLTEDWSASHSAESVCLSIISMLSSCKEKVGDFYFVLPTSAVEQIRVCPKVR